MAVGKRRTVRRKLLEAGFKESAGKKTGHRKYKHPDGRWTQIDWHSKPDIPHGTMGKIARESGLSIAYLTGAE